MRGDWLTLRSLGGYEDAALLAARLATGSFLVHGVWDNVTSGARMAEFAAFMRAGGFVAPGLLAPFSVWTQLAAAVLLILGLLTRWAGLVGAATFVVALWVVHWEQTFREWWPALSLVALGLVFATRGAGRYAIDRTLDCRTDAPK